MKKLVPNTPVEFRISDLMGREIIAYKSSGGEGYCHLIKVASDLYAFVPLNSSSSSIRYSGKTWFDAVNSAAKARQLWVFSSQKDLIEAMHLNKF